MPLPRVFEPLFTTKEKGKGTGLGLAMVYGFVKQSGGYIDISSELGAGTILKIYLPKAGQDVLETESHLVPEAVLSGKGTILLVEDDRPLRQLTVRLLRSFGYQVLEAQDATSALTISDLVKDRIDLLLTDVVLPKINGRVLAGMLLDKRPESQSFVYFGVHRPEYFWQYSPRRKLQLSFKALLTQRACTKSSRGNGSRTRSKRAIALIDVSGNRRNL